MYRNFLPVTIAMVMVAGLLGDPLAQLQGGSGHAAVSDLASQAREAQADAIPQWHWEPTVQMPIGRATGHMTLLSDGSSMLVGGKLVETGQIPERIGGYSSHAVIYDPASGQWRNAGQSITGTRAYGCNCILIALSNERAFFMEVSAPKDVDPSGAAFHLYDGTSNRWEDLPGPAREQMPGYYYDLTAASALDDHTVVVAMDVHRSVAGSGYRTSTSVFSFNIDSKKWSQVAPLAEPRCCGAMTRLADGRILLTGGRTDEYLGLPFDEAPDPTASVAVVNFKSGNHYSKASSMHNPRLFHSATTLSDGRVLVVGGTPWKPAELYDPLADEWTEIEATRHDAYTGSIAITPSGGAIVTGGWDNSQGMLWRHAEWLVPETGRWLKLDPPPAMDGISHAQMLTSDQILFVGWGRVNSAMLVRDGSVRPTPTSVASGRAYLPLNITHISR